MVDVHERMAFEPPAGPAEDVRVTYTSGSRGLPIDPVDAATSAMRDAFGFGDFVQVVEEATAESGIVVSHVSTTMRLVAEPRSVAGRKTAREVFEDSKARFPKIMARLAE